MQFSYYRIIYFNIILLILFLMNQFILFFFVLFYKLPYLLNFESDIEYQFDFIYINLDDIDARYLENDIDNEYYYILIHMESYLYFNCRFFFDVLGGETALDFVDFLDFTIYKCNDILYQDINRNYKNIYSNNIIYINRKTINDLYFYKIYQLIDYSINDNYLKNQIDFLNNINGKKRKSEEQEHKKDEIWNRNQRELQKNLRKELKSQLFMYENKVFDKIKEQRRFKIFN